MTFSTLLLEIIRMNWREPSEPCTRENFGCGLRRGKSTIQEKLNNRALKCGHRRTKGKTHHGAELLVVSRSLVRTPLLVEEISRRQFCVSIADRESLDALGAREAQPRQLFDQRLAERRG
jgi:hypothetical protein